MLEIRLLGGFDLVQDGQAVTIASRPAQSLFAYLILNPKSAHRREKLAGLFWPESEDDRARDYLRHALWRIRKALESLSSTSLLESDDLTIGLKGGSEYWLDVAALVKLGENASPDQLMAGLAEYRGELLPGFYDDWVVLEREHLASIFEHRMAQLLSHLQAHQRWLDVLDWGERWIRLGQEPEPAYRGLMAAHAAKGDMSRVAATYERCARALRKLGLEPSEETRALYESLKAGEKHLSTKPSVSTTAKRESRPRTNVPVPITSFIGREKEIRDVVGLIGTNRLVTLTGLGGVGKTRLAIQSVSKLPAKFRDGIWWVDLALVANGALVPQAVAQTLMVREPPGEPLMDALRSFLRQKQVLLVLDNCEHLITPCAQLAEDLLTHCGSLRILATSREALGILARAYTRCRPCLCQSPSASRWSTCCLNTKVFDCLSSVLPQSNQILC
ncbi:MAG: AfsR/SARP family transcriptional regulator [Bacteroidota bacterium]